ncbi:MAG: DUF4272 domain-containing protein [Clostridiales Family XIII bacterium]|jgi:hypothetical protein|nr:DUF4272 domain-containing protein [Clostridiales Family XIII bacterium]
MGLFGKSKQEVILTPLERRNNTIEKLKKMGISYNEGLPTIESSSEITVKDIDVICKRAIGCLFSASCAATMYSEQDALIADIIKSHIAYLSHYDIAYDDLLPQEKLIFSSNFTPQNVINVAWSYEIYWGIIWASNLITNKEMIDASKICRVERAVGILLETSKDYDFFKGMFKLRSVEKILDMLDLYYCYHWACRQKRLHPDISSIGKLNEEVVMERRKALEWLIREEQDWDEIPLDT